jgi:hypothetical protein
MLSCLPYLSAICIITRLHANLELQFWEIFYEQGTPTNTQTKEGNVVGGRHSLRPNPWGQAGIRKAAVACLQSPTCDVVCPIN